MNLATYQPNSIESQERAKYEAIWEFDEYRKKSPGLESVDRFMSVIKPSVGSSILDIGCGQGLAGLRFEELGLIVHYLDITGEALDPRIETFIQKPIWELSSGSWPYDLEGWDYGFCCDVMEHLPTEYTMMAVDRILSCCGKTWFQIFLEPDGFGAMIGQDLHLTVRPYSWWLDRLRSVGDVIDARDLCNVGLFIMEER